MKRTEACGIEYIDWLGVRWWNAHEGKPPRGAPVLLAKTGGIVHGGVYEDDGFWSHAGFRRNADWWAIVESPSIEPRRKNED